MTIRRTLLLFLPSLAIASAASADTLRLTLDDAIRRALSDATQARLARSAEERARVATREAFYGLLPQADARVLRYNESINLQTFGFEIPGQPPVVGPFNVTDAQITGAVQLFNLAALQLWRARQQGAAASRHQTEQVENDLVAAVARLYVFVQRADAQIGSREADVKLFEELARIAKDEFEAGTGTKLDVAQANLQVSRAREALLTARNDRANAALALLNAIGADESDDVVAADPLPVPTEVPALDPTLTAARTNRPELKAYEARVREAQLAVESARARRVPRIGLDFQGDLSGNKSTDLLWTRRIAGTVTLPIFHGDVEAAIARAKLEQHDVETQRDQVARDVERDVRTSILSLQNAEERVAVASDAAKVAEDALTIARDRRAAGYGSPVEVDRAEDQYQQARQALIAAQADAALAQVNVQHATGDIRARVARP